MNKVMSKKEGKWGDLKTKARRGVFNSYLEELKSADRFLSRGGVLFLRGLSVISRQKIMARLKSVDPEGYESLLRLRRATKRMKRKELSFLTKKEVDEAVLLIEETPKKACTTRTTALIVADPNGLVEDALLWLAVGKGFAEVATRTGLPESYLRERITSDMIRAKAKSMEEEVSILANQKVVRDLMEDNVTKTTEMADKIVERRRKGYATLSAERRAAKGESEKDIAARYEKQYGVTIDTEEANEDR